jgi:transposase-like protein
MARNHKPEEIIGKLREAEIVLAQGGTVADACRRIGVTEQSYYRWRKEYGGLKLDQARRMKELERGNLPATFVGTPVAEAYFNQDNQNFWSRQAGRVGRLLMPSGRSGGSAPRGNFSVKIGACRRAPAGR